MTGGAAKNSTVSLVRELDGVYYAVSPLLAAVIDRIKQQASADAIFELLREKHPRLERHQLHALLSQLFGAYGLRIQQHSGAAGACFSFAADIAATDGRHGSRYLLAAWTLLPNRLANRLSGYLIWLYTPPGAAVMLASLAGLLAMFCAKDGWRALSLTVLSAAGGLTPAQLLAVTAAVGLSFVFHELGHSSAALLFNVRVRRIGIGLYWIFPVLFSDVTAVWSLARRQRLLVDVGGIYFQALACIPLLLFGMLTGDPGWRTAAACGIAVNTLTVVTNLNPLLRYDGYWMYSDLSGIPNLRKQSTALMHTLYHSLWHAARRVGLWSLIRGNGVLFLYAVLSLLFSLFFSYYVIRSMLVSAAALPEFLLAVKAVLHGAAALALPLAAVEQLLVRLWSLLPLAVMPLLLLYVIAELYLFFKPPGRQGGALAFRKLEIH